MTDELILVVDDEPFVLNIVCSVLENAGFRCCAPPRPPKPCQIAEQQKTRSVCCSPTSSCPDSADRRLADRFTEIHPETEFMFMAGLPDSPEVCDRILSRGRAFLPKPFVPRTLLDKVHEVLGARPRRPGVRQLPDRRSPTAVARLCTIE